ncbi:membrane integrity-associated transporter subunit PqiC [Belnapia sp. T18]|uniref:Membrane integrity-associated transporter subunit PqiC n=1 Tax=Belnapia arida TaxID=2804533 RepID=A0ABS1U7M3_9PROT|nr:PqiC family protein [Belnapia arida]MBL6079717.1 membrane integrity-associated transporter subunit PqiC [Belnapia arida]
MRRRQALFAGLAMAGCASPEPELYRLVAVPGVPRARAPGLIELRRVGVPAYLDRSQIIRALAESQLQALGARWAEPFGDMVTRVLAEDLMQRLAGSTVLTETGSLRGEAGLIIETEIQRFEAGPGPRVVLLAQFALRPPGGATRAARVQRAEVPLAGEGMPNLVAAMSAALGQLADTMAGLATAR